nr:hypothetical protein B0A51_12187 [Rachicladosporium sp. CCFEE 5018]
MGLSDYTGWPYEDSLEQTLRYDPTDQTYVAKSGHRISITTVKAVRAAKQASTSIRRNMKIRAHEDREEHARAVAQVYCGEDNGSSEEDDEEISVSQIRTTEKQGYLTGSEEEVEVSGQDSSSDGGADSGPVSRNSTGQEAAYMARRDTSQQQTGTANSGNNSKPRSNNRNAIRNGNNCIELIKQYNLFDNRASNPDRGNQSAN